MATERDAAVTDAWVEAAEWAALWPVSVFTAWVLIDCPAGRPHRRAHKRRHHDLAVPEPIERAGEHDLFA
ncbi:MAG: hypothetical protein MT490_06770 [Sphingomonas sp.]|uniref:hypothetical protein n=1 Tax=Sphingomonas sp. TaxID=28214 RepID=UPI0022726B55|nr:hypothetical protein [Sphingomonas sp.]MCX8475485.1 hypothetical protein [Sphingomonas sp.]